MSEKFNYEYIINKTTTTKQKTKALENIRQNMPDVSFCFRYVLVEENKTVLCATNRNWSSMFDTAGRYEQNIFYLNDINELKTYYDLTGSLLDYSTIN